LSTSTPHFGVAHGLQRRLNSSRFRRRDPPRSETLSRPRHFRTERAQLGGEALVKDLALLKRPPGLRNRDDQRYRPPAQGDVGELSRRVALSFGVILMVTVSACVVVCIGLFLLRNRDWFLRTR
jgi:hypothetical protein